MQALLAEDLEVFALHAATAFEHLAKARLAGIHPSLVADGRDFQSLLQACGAARLVRQPERPPRSITLGEALDRVAQIEGHIKPHAEALRLLADARNGVAHIGEKPGDLDRTVVVPFARACEALLPILGIERADFWGPYLGTIDARLSTAANEAEVRVADKLTRARAQFGQRFGPLERPLAGQLLVMIAENYNLEKYESRIVSCPACDSDAHQTGYYEVEWEVDVEYEGPDEYTTNAYPKVTVIGEYITCDACGLELEGFDELRAAGIDVDWEVEDADPADFYEPDYE